MVVIALSLLLSVSTKSILRLLFSFLLDLFASVCVCCMALVGMFGVVELPQEISIVVLVICGIAPGTI